MMSLQRRRVLELAAGAAMQAVRGLFTYNLLAAVYLGYLRGSGSFAGDLLWPAAVLHGLLAVLLARPAYVSLAGRQRPQ